MHQYLVVHIAVHGVKQFVYTGYFYHLNAHRHFKVIQSIFEFLFFNNRSRKGMAKYIEVFKLTWSFGESYLFLCFLETADRRVKSTKFWASGVNI